MLTLDLQIIFWQCIYCRPVFTFCVVKLQRHRSAEVLAGLLFSLMTVIGSARVLRSNLMNTLSLKVRNWFIDPSEFPMCMKAAF